MDVQFWMVIRMIIGYARVSTQDQNLDLQTEVLTRAGCEKIYEEKISSVLNEHSELTRALEILCEGDTMVVWRLDRLGRSVKKLVAMVGGQHKQGIQFKMLLIQEHWRDVSVSM